MIKERVENKLFICMSLAWRQGRYTEGGGVRLLFFKKKTIKKQKKKTIKKQKKKQNKTQSFKLNEYTHCIWLWHRLACIGCHQLLHQWSWRPKSSRRSLPMLMAACGDDDEATGCEYPSRAVYCSSFVCCLDSHQPQCCCYRCCCYCCCCCCCCCMTWLCFQSLATYQSPTPRPRTGPGAVQIGCWWWQHSCALARQTN